MPQHVALNETQGTHDTRSTKGDRGGDRVREKWACAYFAAFSMDEPYSHSVIAKRSLFDCHVAWVRGCVDAWSVGVHACVGAFVQG